MKLEERLCAMTGRRYCIVFSTGFTALTTALIISGKRSALLPSHTCFAVLGAIHFAGMESQFGEIELKRFQMPPQVVAGEPQASAIIAVHSLGMLCDVTAWEKHCADSGSFLIEDACLALRGKLGNRPAGSFGNCSVLSFGYDKIVDAGGGGALLMDDEELYVNAHRIHSSNTLFYCPQEMVRKISVALDGLDVSLAIRHENARYLDKHLETSYIMKPVIQSGDPVWRYTFLTQGDAIPFIEKAKREGILMTHHYQPLHVMKTGVTLENVECFSKSVVNVFVRPGTTREYLERVVDFVNVEGGE